MASVLAASSYSRISFSLYFAVSARRVRVPCGSKFHLEPVIILCLSAADIGAADPLLSPPPGTSDPTTLTTASPPPYPTPPPWRSSVMTTRAWPRTITAETMTMGSNYPKLQGSGLTLYLLSSYSSPHFLRFCCRCR